MNARGDVFDSGLVAVGRALRRRELSVVELVTHSLDRIRASAFLNAYIEVYDDRAREIAGAHQRLLDSGYDLGPLHGIPFALKDNIDMAGVVTTVGSAIRRGVVAGQDATVVAALKRAGAIFMGKNNLHEFAWGGTTDNPHYGTARNPWDPSRTPAGSSGGSAAAVAAGTVLGAIGTDTGGSVRIPAAVNGVTGIRPTIGRISNSGVFPNVWTLDTVGVFARSSEDCATVLQVIAGQDPRDAQTLPEPVPNYRAQLQRSLAGMTVGWIDDYSVRNIQVDVRSAFESALAAIEALGATVIPVKISDLDSAVDALTVLHGGESSALHTRRLRERGSEYGADVRAQIEAGLVISAADYLAAQRVRTHIRQRFREAFDRVDAILTPTLAFTAPKIGDRFVELGSHCVEISSASTQFTALASVSGLPALSVPIGLDGERLPIGLQIITPAFQEGRALTVAHQLQREGGFSPERLRPEFC